MPVDTKVSNDVFLRLDREGEFSEGTRKKSFLQASRVHNMEIIQYLAPSFEMETLREGLIASMDSSFCFDWLISNTDVELDWNTGITVFQKSKSEECARYALKFLSSQEGSMPCVIQIHSKEFLQEAVNAGAKLDGEWAHAVQPYKLYILALEEMNVSDRGEAIEILLTFYKYRDSDREEFEKAILEMDWISRTYFLQLSRKSGLFVTREKLKQVIPHFRVSSIDYECEEDPEVKSVIEELGLAPAKKKKKGLCRAILRSVGQGCVWWVSASGAIGVITLTVVGSIPVALLRGAWILILEGVSLPFRKKYRKKIQILQEQYDTWRAEQKEDVSVIEKLPCEALKLWRQNVVTLSRPVGSKIPSLRGNFRYPWVKLPTEAQFRADLDDYLKQLVEQKAAKCCKCGRKK